MKYQLGQDEDRHTGRRKQTSRWCKGRPGVEHDYEERDWAEYKRWPWAATSKQRWKIKVCKTCGKQRWGK